MQSPVINYNINRHYKFTFFSVNAIENKTTGVNTFEVVNDPSAYIQDSVNFNFNYTVTNTLNNTITINFYNLSAASLGLFANQNNRRGFQFDAWYGNNTQGNITIFRGLTYTVNNYRVGADIITEVVGCDIFLNLLQQAHQQTFPAGTSYLQIVQKVLGDYGSVLALNPASKQFLTGIYKTPKVYTCQPYTILEIISKDAGLIFAIQQNIITFAPKGLDQVLPKSDQIISQKNGLVGYVRPIALSIQLFSITYFTEQNLNKNVPLLSVTTLLRHYDLYSAIHLTSENYDGEYGVLSVTHSGEWRSNTWYSSLVLWPSPGDPNAIAR